MLGLTAYKAIDPVVFSVTAGWRFGSERQDGGQDYKPGSLILLNPSVGFAANDRVTLTSGLQWTRRAADRLDGKPQASTRPPPTWCWAWATASIKATP